MKKLFVIIVMILSVMPFLMAAGGGGSINGSIGVDPVGPLVFQCGQRVLLDDEVQPWRITGDGENMIERNQQYLFDGERYQVDVLVFDKAKIDEVQVDLQLEGEGINSTTSIINCVPNDVNFTACNARIDEEELEFDPNTMQGYTCSIDILDSQQMYGITTMSVIADNPQTNGDGVYAEIAKWFINPIISLGVDGDLDFSDTRPGTSSYSTVYLKNNAEGGVLLDMFITGDNWPSVGPSLGRCWDAPNNQYVNYLPLSAFTYYSENGAFSTRDDAAEDNGYSSVVRAVDSEGYVNINQQINAGFEEAMFNDAEIIQANPVMLPNGKNMYIANLLYPGSVGMSITFRLNLPEPCYGQFESGPDGSIFFWGEAV